MDFVYRGASMHRVFRVGDRLHAETIDFSEIKKGDIICFDSGSKYIVHRVVQVVADHVVTMGDNNAEPDKDPVTAAMKPELVINYDRNGKIIPVSRGDAGMRQFYFNRFRRGLRHGVSKIFHLTKPLFLIFGHFFKIPVKEKTCFFKETCYSINKRLIAKKVDGGKLRYEKWYYPLIFRVVDE